jgi:hypothetical protein
MPSFAPSSRGISGFQASALEVPRLGLLAGAALWRRGEVPDIDICGGGRQRNDKTIGAFVPATFVPAGAESAANRGDNQKGERTGKEKGRAPKCAARNAGGCASCLSYYLPLRGCEAMVG